MAFISCRSRLTKVLAGAARGKREVRVGGAYYSVEVSNFIEKTSDYGVHEVGVTVCGVQHVLGIQPGNQIIQSFFLQ